ncbi:MAG: zinc-dependent metalloprotease [Kordia sp.]|uniref:zinc-dependent metalloprotease n=1 Tax=Kordia sp. TaxID=1965332 RepID=UPI00385BF2B4
MKKIYVLMLCLTLGITSMFAQTLKPVATEVVNAKAKNVTFTDVSSLIQIQQNDGQLKGLKDATEVSLFTYNKDFFQKSLANQEASAITMIVPLQRDFSVTVDLVEVSASFYDYVVTTNSGKANTTNNTAKHYRGIVRGNETNSLVAISILESQMMGTVSIEGRGAYNIGKLKNKDTHIIFKSDNVESESFACDEVETGTGEDALPYTNGQIQTSNPADSMDKCVDIYFEVDFDIYEHFGSNIADVEDFVIALFNQTATIYQNESINVQISEIFVWDTQDPYTSNIINTFRTTRTTFNGDLAHLLTFRSSSAGGSAYVNVLCNDNFAYGQTSLFPSIETYPTYSRQVKVVTHEIGHNLGSRHTHDCVWNGNSTQIDDYGNEFSNGTPVSNPPACYSSPGMVNVTPTIMSYYDSFNHGTFPMSNGFGMQPGNVVRNGVANADCLDDCEGGCTAEISYTVNGAPMTTGSGAYTIEECLFQCITVAANGDVASATYNTTAAVLNNTEGLFCVQPGSGITSFTVDIDGIDSCGDPFTENINITVIPCTHENCCDEENNMLTNGNFDDASCTGSTAFGQGCVTGWNVEDGSPSLHGVNRHAWMWSYGGNGEAIETSFAFEEGVTYDICFSLRTGDRNTGDPNVANNATVNLVATNNPGVVTGTPNGQIVFQNTMGDYLNNWQNVTIQFTPDANYGHLWIFPFMADASDGTSQSEMSIDNIVISNCCNDEPEIVPYWQHPSCPEVVCTADQWPIHVKSSDGSNIINGNGVTVVWDNLDTAVNENDIQDWIFASAGETWQATITYPNGCEYIITYYEDCCDEDIYIKVYECPSSDQLQTHQTSLEKRMEAVRSGQSVSTKSSSQAQEAQIQEELDRLRAYMEVMANSDGDDCEPCELGSILIELVDANGDPIDIDDYDTFSWDHNGSQATSVLVDLPMENGPICFTATNTEYGKECVYQDCFFYECEEKCAAPTDLRFDCRRASMSWTGDPSLTYVVEVTWDDPNCRSCKGTRPNQMRWEVQGNSFSLPYIDRSGCFSWRIGTKCEDGIKWSDSVCEDCYSNPTEGPTKPQESASVKTSAKISPNPNDGNMNIEISGQDKTSFNIKVYRFDGILIKSFDTNHIENNTTTISWNGKSVLTPGMYFFVITTDTETITKKVIIK